MNKRNAFALSLFTTTLAFIALIQSSPVKAQGYYGEIGLTPLHLKSEAGDISHPQTMRFLIGKDIHENLAIEGLYVATYSKDSRPGFDAKATHYGLLLKPKYAITTETEVFARIGVAHSNFTATSVEDRRGSDLAYGIGLQTYFSKSIYGQIDYMNYYDKEGQSSKGYTVSIGTRF
jgi:opacity protein-like surface antigen